MNTHLKPNWSEKLRTTVGVDQIQLHLHMTV
jgi:hypothetical protein